MSIHTHTQTRVCVYIYTYILVYIFTQLCKIVTTLMYNKLYNIYFGIQYTNFYIIIIEHKLIVHLFIKYLHFQSESTITYTYIFI